MEAEEGGCGVMELIIETDTLKTERWREIEVC